ncbi:MAG: acyl-CoA dehydrogenase family protein [Dietzia psychralcaliphila]
MTATAIPVSTSTPVDLDSVLETVAARADDLDRGEGAARDVLPLLASTGALDAGLSRNRDGGLSGMVETLAQVSACCLSSAFTAWAHRMTMEYLAQADTPYSRDLLTTMVTGERPGVTGMASAFRELAGCGSLDVTATVEGEELVLDGTLRWASNLYEDAVLVTAARTTTGDRILVALPVDTPGVTVGPPFSLMALGSTASSFLKIENVRIGAHQVLTSDFEAFLTAVRPTFVMLQTALCVGLATTALEEARSSLIGVNAVFAGEVDRLVGKLALVRSAMTAHARAEATAHAAGRAEVLAMRLQAAEVAFEAAILETKSAGGKGYARSSGTSRRMREAVFFPVQSPSEAQLRWELATCA